jgi:hypothetical protein
MSEGTIAWAALILVFGWALLASIWSVFQALAFAGGWIK